MSIRSRRQSKLFPILASIAMVCALHCLWMAAAGHGWLDPNPYNSYTLQAQSWLEGHLDLGQNYPWLEFAVFHGKYYLSFPPFPSYVLLPFVLLFGTRTPDTLIALAVTLIGTGYAAALVGHFSQNQLYRVLLPVFLYCGTALWQVTVDGSVWFIAQNMALCLTLASLYYAIKRRKGLALFLLVAAVGCRPFQITAFPVMLALLWPDDLSLTVCQKAKQLLFHKLWAWLPAVLLAGSFLWLNFARFHDPFDFGRAYLPEFVASEHGQFNAVYFWGNLPCLWRTPPLGASAQSIAPPYCDGFNVLIAFPIVVWYLFLLALRATQLRSPTERSVWGRLLLLNGLILLMASLQTVLFLFHRTMGGVHFGNRYIGDTLALTYLGICLLSSGPSDCEDGSSYKELMFIGIFFTLLLGGTFYYGLGTLRWFCNL